MRPSRKIHRCADGYLGETSWEVILAAGRHFIHARVGLGNEPQIHSDVVPGQNLEGSVNLQIMNNAG